MVKILVSVANNQPYMHTQFCLSLFNLFFYTKKFHEVEMRFYEIWDVAGMRNLGAKDALKDGFDYVFFLDSDMIYPADSILKLLEHQKDVIGGYYIKRVPPLVSTQYRTFDIRGFGLLDPLAPDQGVQEIAATGFGGVLIKTEIFKDMEYPYFEMIHMSNGEVFGEDTYFCKKVHEKGLKVYSDTTLHYGHIIDAAIYPGGKVKFPSER